MDSVVAQHSCLQTLLIYHDLKNYFILLKNELFFLNELIYGRRFVINLNGKKEGLELYYYGFGEKRYNLSWKNGKREGLGILYRSGVKWIEKNWKAGKREGLEIWYFQSGKKEYEINYKDDEKEGPEIRYHESGKKEYEKVWKEGELISEDY